MEFRIECVRGGEGTRLASFVPVIRRIGRQAYLCTHTLCFLFFDCFSNSIAVLHISNAADAIFTAEQINTTSSSSSYVAILGYFSHAHSKSAQLVAQQIHNKSHKWSLTIIGPTVCAFMRFYILCRVSSVYDFIKTYRCNKVMLSKPAVGRFGIERHPCTKSRIDQIPFVCVCVTTHHKPLNRFV